MAIKVTNATAVYAIMVIVFAAGLWAILAIGSTLQAPPDLAGDWQLISEHGGKAEPQAATIEQSGRFLRLRLNGGPTYEMRLSDEPDAAHNGLAAGRVIHLRGDSQSARFEQTPAPDVYRLRLDQPQRATYTARIVARMYPRHAAARFRSHAEPDAKH